MILWSAEDSAVFTFNGHHHEVYLSDPRRTKPAKLRSILRQPVADLGL